MFTEAQYKLIAKRLREDRVLYATENCYKLAVWNWVNTFEHDDPNFNPAAFRAECYK